MILGIEGTAHTLGVGVVGDDFSVLADVRKTYHPDEGGIHPRQAAQFLGESARQALDEALSEAGAGWDDIELVSFSRGPGMGPCLRTAATAARTVSAFRKIPLVGVNHCIAHIEVGRVLSGFTDPLVLYVSGANTQVIKLSEGRYRVFGETLDVGCGNLLDKFGRKTGLAHPAGPKIEELARDGNKFIPLPYVVKGTDLSFSGLFTAAVQKVEKGERMQDVCFSLQETAFSMLVEVTERALAHLKGGEVLLAGGVAFNRRLQEMVGLMSQEHDAKFSVPGRYCGDNGVMIAMLGKKMYDAGIETSINESIVLPKQRTDDVSVVWK